MAAALAFGGFLVLIGGAIYLMWTPLARHDRGRNDAGSAGGDGAWSASGESHHGHSGDSGGGGGDAGASGDGS